MAASFMVIVPARLASTRLPRKALADIGGLPMVARTALNAAESGARVVVATDSDEIAAACGAHRVEAVMTAAAHPTGTDRLAEAARLLALEPDQIVVNVQGDEPLIPSAVIRQVAQLLDERGDCEMATVAHPLTEARQLYSPDVVKVVADASGRALYFSRAPIPWARDAFARSHDTLPDGLPALRHVGLYAYRTSFLLRFAGLTPSPLEQFEALEQLRALAHGVGVAVLALPRPWPAGVDTAEDLERVRALFASSRSGF